MIYDLDTATRFVIIDALISKALASDKDTAALCLDALEAIDAHTSADAVRHVLDVNAEFHSVRA